VEKTGKGFVAHGTLTIRGVSKDVDLPFELVGPVSTPKAKLLAANGTLTINRQDFGVAWNQPFNNGFAVSNDVLRLISALRRTSLWRPHRPPQRNKDYGGARSLITGSTCSARKHTIFAGHIIIGRKSNPRTPWRCKQRRWEP